MSLKRKRIGRLKGSLEWTAWKNGLNGLLKRVAFRALTYLSTDRLDTAQWMASCRQGMVQENMVVKKEQPGENYLKQFHRCNLIRRKPNKKVNRMIKSFSEDSPAIDDRSLILAIRFKKKLSQRFGKSFLRIISFQNVSLKKLCDSPCFELVHNQLQQAKAFFSAFSCSFGGSSTVAIVLIWNRLSGFVSNESNEFNL